MRNHTGMLVVAAAVICCFVTADRALTHIAVSGSSFEWLGGWFRFSLLKNPAIAFSIGMPEVLTMILVPIVAVFCIAVALQRFRSNDFLRGIILTSIAIAAGGNYLDRIQYGYVIDYVHIGNWFPVFNVNDAVMTVAVVWLIFSVMREPKKTA